MIFSQLTQPKKSQTNMCKKMPILLCNSIPLFGKSLHTFMEKFEKGAIKFA